MCIFYCQVHRTLFFCVYYQVRSLLAKISISALTQRHGQVNNLCLCPPEKPPELQTKYSFRMGICFIPQHTAISAPSMRLLLSCDANVILNTGFGKQLSSALLCRFAAAKILSRCPKSCVHSTRHPSRLFKPSKAHESTFPHLFYLQYQYSPLRIFKSIIFNNVRTVVLYLKEILFSSIVPFKALTTAFSPKFRDCVKNRLGKAENRFPVAAETAARKVL